MPSRNTERNRQRERHQTEHFLSSLGPQYKIVEHGDAPDFVVTDGQMTFALEHTQVFRDQGKGGSQLRGTESDRGRYVARLADAYYGRGGLPLMVQARLVNYEDIDIERLSGRLVRRRPAESMSRFEFAKGQSKFSLVALPDAFPGYRAWQAVNNSVGWVDQLSTDALEAVIAKKVAKLPRYRGKFDRVELLLVVDVTKNSGMVRWPSDAPLPAAPGFDEVRLYYYPERASREGRR